MQGFIARSCTAPYLTIHSGDPWLPLRALLAAHTVDAYVGGDSAAWLLGYARRSPERHIVVVPAKTQVSWSLRQVYRVLETAPAPALGPVDGLPVPDQS